jgi:hypothetical protein
MYEKYWASFRESLGTPETYYKLLFLLLTAPIWFPVVKAMWKELQFALAPEGGLFGRDEQREVAVRAPGEDPWLNVPRARYRGRLAARTGSRQSPAPGPGAAARSAPQRSAPVRAARRRGF